MEFISSTVRQEALTYEQYRHLVTTLLAQGQQTGLGVPDSPEMLEYTRLNQQRMNRIEKTFKLDAEAATMLHQIRTPTEWLVITEGWCGDAAQIVPTLQHLAQINPNIQLRFLLRDQHLDIMDGFLTNGGRSIPKVLFVEPTTGRVQGHWGPRPIAAQVEMSVWTAKMKAATDEQEKHAHYEAAKTAIHTWYAHDKTVSTQREVLAAAIEH